MGRGTSPSMGLSILLYVDISLYWALYFTSMYVEIRVVNIAVLVLLPIVSAILFEYWLKYRQYFS